MNHKDEIMSLVTNFVDKMFEMEDIVKADQETGKAHGLKIDQYYFLAVSKTGVWAIIPHNERKFAAMVQGDNPNRESELISKYLKLYHF